MEMSIELITLLMISTFLVLLVSGLPLAWTMGATAVLWCLIPLQPGRAGNVVLAHFQAHAELCDGLHTIIRFHGQHIATVRRGRRSV